MTTNEIAIVIGGALLGYWMVTTLLGSKAKRDGDHNQTFEKNERQNESGESGSTSKTVEDGDITANWFRILEVAESASKDEIASAYKKKISQYHPDKVATLGAELRELAEVKSKQINAAYDYAVKLRG